MQRILVVDDDRVQVDVVSMLLRRVGFEPTAAFDAESASRLFQEQQPDLVILDVQLGDADGRDLLRQFRKQRPKVLILMLTVLNAEDDRVYGLELGADDYVTKPFGPRELIARVQALVRRGSVNGGEIALPRRIQLGSVVLDPMSHEVSRSGARVDLSPTEFRLLHMLMAHPNALVTTRTLLKEVWGHHDMTARNVLRVTASRLRSKLEVDPSHPRLVRTIPGEGLIFRADEARPTAAPNQTEAPVALEMIIELQELMGDLGTQPLHHLNEVFASHVARHISIMRSALTKRQPQLLADEAHRLRGSSASLGAQRMVKVCAMIEERAKAGELTQLEDLIEQLEQEMEAFETAIVPILDRRSA